MVLLKVPRTGMLLAACLLATACATSPLDTSGVSSRATPSEATQHMPEVQGERVQWGGHIVSIVNKDQGTRVEVLSYPLARDGFPNTNRRATGRFVLKHDGFLEPQDYAPGRLVTVVGTIDSLVRTSVQETEFVVPQVNAEQLQLWDERYSFDNRNPRFGFGVGISIGF